LGELKIIRQVFTPRFQAALKEPIAHSGKISLEIEAIQWLSSKGHEWLLGSAGPQILLDFKQHSTRLPLMMRWVHSAAEKQLRYLFLSNRENDFKGHSRDEWLELSRKSDEMAAFGEESEIYKSFEGKEVDEMVSFRSNQFRIIDLEFDY